MLILALLACADPEVDDPAACRGGDAEACARLGLLDEACAHDHVASCLAVGRSAEACTLGHAESCRSLGRAEEACHLGDGRSCWTLGAQAAWERDDAAAALPLFRQACGLGEPLGCTGAGLLLTPGDRGQALELYRRACDIDGSGCALLQATQAALDDAEPCADGDVEACARLCRRADPGGCARAADTLRRRCEAAEADACTLLGTALARGWGVAPVPAEAPELLWAGCRGNDPWGCLRLADAVESGADNPAPRSLAWLRNQVCDLQLWYGCAVH